MTTRSVHSQSSYTHRQKRQSYPPQIQYHYPAPGPLFVRQPSQQSYVDSDARRLHLQAIALATVEAINNGIVDVSKTRKRTQLYSPDSPELADWRDAEITSSWYRLKPVKIFILPMTTLQGAQHLHNTYLNKRLAILNFASATRPGGGFYEGARAQEESIARSSTLYVSLTTESARPFYALHEQDDRGGFYSHSMIYSPNIHIFRDDIGNWHSPYQLDVLTCAAVNAGKAHKVFYDIPQDELDNEILVEMRERMARILALFEKRRARNLVLGSFGTGVFRNDIRAIAGIWKDLLIMPNARFATSFENIVFAIPDDFTKQKFESVFLGLS